MQVLFCSRTHSQLSQFIGELRRTPFASSASAVALASRKSLCVNEEVLRLRGAAQINEKCLDMQGSKGRAKQRTGEAAPGKGRRRRPKATARCPFLAHKPEAHEACRPPPSPPHPPPSSLLVSGLPRGLLGARSLASRDGVDSFSCRQCVPTSWTGHSTWRTWGSSGEGSGSAPITPRGAYSRRRMSF